MAFKNILAITPDGHEGYRSSRGFKKDDPAISYLDFFPLIRRHGIREAQRLIAQAVADKKPDLLLVTLLGANYQFPIDFFIDLRRLAPLVFFFYDDENYLEVHGRYYGQAADAVVTTDYFGTQAYSRMGVPGIFYPPNISSELFYPVAVDPDIDVCFLGDCTKSDRMDYVNFLLSNGIKVEIFGKGSKGGHIDASRMSEIYCRAKINLNFSKTDDLSWVNEAEPLLRRVRQNKGRPVEIALTGSFCLTEYYPALPHLFEIGKEIGYFCDKESLLAKVRYYLENEDERRTVAKRGYHRALEDYEAIRNIPRILEKIEDALNSRPCPVFPTAYMNDDVKERQVNVLFVHLISALRRRQIGVALEIFPTLFQHGLRVFAIGALSGVSRGISILRKQMRHGSKKSS
mgnify:CR=1 FL=1